MLENPSVSRKCRGVARVLVIAGSDSGAGAGIQADLKAVAARNCYATTAITSVTAQNTLEVTAVHDIPPEIIAKQIDAILSDSGTDAVKIGMLANSEIVRVVAQKLKKLKVEQPDIPIILDPVMISKGGSSLLQNSAISTLISELIPLATIITPNLDEAIALVKHLKENHIHTKEHPIPIPTKDNDNSQPRPKPNNITGSTITIKDDEKQEISLPVITEIHDVETMKKVAVQLYRFGPKYVLLKGGHLKNSADCTDILYDGISFSEYTSPRYETTNTHGTGCTFASAIAAEMAKGKEVKQAVMEAKEYISGAIKDSYYRPLGIGTGHGPLNHFYSTHFSS
jgi:hydroxymethylpyrimidine/phosphomethylpyrimidine kinase